MAQKCKYCGLGPDETQFISERSIRCLPCALRRREEAAERKKVYRQSQHYRDLQAAADSRYRKTPAGKKNQAVASAKWRGKKKLEAATLDEN